MALFTPDAVFGGTVETTKSMAIWRLKPLGLDDATAQRLEGLLRTEAGLLKNVVLQDKDKTIRRLATRTELRACGGKTSCLCQIGKILNVDQLVTGVIGALGDDYTFDLKLLDVKTCRESRRINEALSGREDLLISAIRKALYKLIAPELVVGSLLVDVPVNGASIFVDDKLVAKTPLRGAISGLRPGLHRLKISAKGFSEFVEDVPVRFQQTTMLKVDLVKSVLTGLSYEKEKDVKEGKVSKVTTAIRMTNPKKPTSVLTVLAWTSGGLAILAAGTAGVLGWRAKVAENEVQQAANSDPPYINSSYDEVLGRARTYAFGANIGWAVAGAFALSSTIMFIVDLVSDDSEQDGRPGSVQSPSLIVTPGIAPSFGGIKVQIDF